MKIINIWSYICANYLTKQLKESHEKKRVYYYGFQVIIGTIVEILLLLLIGFLAGALLPCFIVLLTFSSLRVIAGGFHMDTYIKCIIASTILLVGAGIISQYTYKYWGFNEILALLLISVVFGIFAIIKWVPSDTPNKPITRKEDIKKFKRLSLLYMLIWSLINAILFYMAYSNNYSILKLINISTCMGLLLQLFMLTPIGYRFFETLSGQKKWVQNR